MGKETSKAHARRTRDGTFRTVLAGRGIDVGCGDDPVTPDCVHWDREQGDAQTLPGLAPESFDWLYSSHCLEDLPDPRAALRRWWEVLKIGGRLLVVVPDEDLYEQGVWPSRFNGDHRRTFTIRKSRSWSPASLNLADLLAELPGHRILWIKTCDDGYDHGGGVWDRTHGPAEAAIEACVVKLSAVSDQPSAPNASQRPTPNALTPESGIHPGGVVSFEPIRIYTGVLGQIGDIVMFSASLRRLRELFPNARITLAVSARYREAGELVAGLPYADRLFVTELYFEKLTSDLFQPWERGWPVDLRGDDEVVEQRAHDLVLETRPRHRRERWWEHAHQVEETAAMVGVPGPIDRRTEIRVPSDVRLPPGLLGKIVLHNDPAIDSRKAWPWEHVQRLARSFRPGEIVLLGNPGPEVPGCRDLRGQTTFPEAAALIAACRCYVGIDSGLMWIAGSLQVPVVGLYGTEYVPNPAAIQPLNPNAAYLQADGPVAAIPPEAVLRHIP